MLQVQGKQPVRCLDMRFPLMVPSELGALCLNTPQNKSLLAQFRLSSIDLLRATLALGAVISIVGMWAHSFFDFKQQLSAQALLFLLLVTVIAQNATASIRRS